MICPKSNLPSPQPRAASSPEQKRSFFWSCFSCRALSGGALIASSLFVYSGPLRIMSHRIPPSMGNIAQMTFAVCTIFKREHRKPFLGMPLGDSAPGTFCEHGPQ
uniref:Distal membrane-arm assembly complex protein 1-like domain-containing protein n=1 Tax=Podarcis muralis TaxID=64176 RepID=A0A670JMG0_PODMU